MIRELQFKPDFQRTVQRFEAWWQGQIVDRTPVSLWVKGQRRPRIAPKTYATLRQRWMDVEYIIDSACARMEATDFIGDTLPIYYPNLGPEITAALFGCELEFSEGTSWSVPIVHEPEGWRRVLTMRPDWNNVYWKTIERMTEYALQAGKGRFLVGITDLHGNYDLLASLRDPQALCEDLMDCPDLVRQAGRYVAEVCAESFRRSYEPLKRAGQGSTTWLSAYHEGPAYVPSCDFWCMVSPQMAREWIWPDIETEMADLERAIFHLDGPQALPHLGLLLESPKINAVQWVYGAGRGPAARWVEVYDRCVKAGKSVQLVADTVEDAMKVLRVTGVHGVWVCVGEAFDSMDSANAFLKEIERMGVRR